MLIQNSPVIKRKDGVPYTAHHPIGKHLDCFHYSTFHSDLQVSITGSEPEHKNNIRTVNNRIDENHRITGIIGCWLL